MRRRQRRPEGEGKPLASHIFISPRTWTPHGTVLSNTGLFLFLFFWIWKKKTKESPRDGDNPTFIRGGVRSYFRFSEEDATMLRDSPTGPCWYFDKGVVLSSCTVRRPCLIFLHFQHLSNSDGLHRPWECLIQCILPEWVFLKLLTGKIGFFFPPTSVFQLQI